MGSAVTGIFCSLFSLYGRHPVGCVRRVGDAQWGTPCDRPPLLGRMFVAPISLLRSGRPLHCWVRRRLQQSPTARKPPRLPQLDPPGWLVSLKLHRPTTQ